MKPVFLFTLSLFVCQIAMAQLEVRQAGLKEGAAEAAVRPHSLKNHREEIQKVILTEDIGVLRGFSFGTSLEAIKKSEKAEYVADGKLFAIFKVALNENEYAEIIYYLDDNHKVNGFGIEFLVQEEAYMLEENIVKDYRAYLTSRFGPSRVNVRGDEVWDAGAYVVEMGNSSEGNTAMEIEIEFFPKN